MRLLLDTRLLLWALAEPHRLGGELQSILEDPAQEVLFSAASIWEIAIKSALRRADVQVGPRDVFEAAIGTGFIELAVRAEAALAVAALPHHHRDPFDRLLVAQALTEPVRLFTADRALAPYSELVVCV